jgi:hypothetical protein
MTFDSNCKKISTHYYLRFCYLGSCIMVEPKVTQLVYLQAWPVHKCLFTALLSRKLQYA